MTQPAKKIRKDLTLEERIKVIDACKNNKQTLVAKKFGIGERTVRRIVSQKDSILKSFESNENRGRKRKRESTTADIDAALYTWFKAQKAKGAPVRGPDCLLKSEELAKKLEVEKFDANEGWLHRWKKRYGITFSVQHGEKREANKEGADEWLKGVLPRLLEEYEDEDIYNADESAVLYRELPMASLDLQENKDKGGFKQNKERFTIMTCTNMTGSDKVPLLVIGKFKTPRCLRDVKPPVDYDYNKSAWMTKAAFNKWLRIFNQRMKARNKSVLLLIDNAPCHTDELQLSNVRVVYLPKNTTSLIQPLDQGIIANLKQHFRKFHRQHIISACEEHADDPLFTAQTVAKKMNILESMHMLRRAWRNVKASTIQKCWAKGGFTRENKVNLL